MFYIVTMALQLPIYDADTFCLIGYTPVFDDEWKFKELNQYKWHQKAGKLFATNDKGKTIYFEPTPPVQSKVEVDVEFDETRPGSPFKKMYSKYSK